MNGALSHEFGNSDSPNMSDVEYAPNTSPIRHGMQADGLPGVALDASIESAMARPLNPDRFICMEDDSEFYDGPNKYDGRVVIDPRTGRYYAETGEALLPKREKCRHYVRQLMPFQGNDDTHNECRRYCTSIKDADGEMYSLNNMELLACEMREPRDFVSEQRLREHDKKVVEASKARLAEEDEDDFDVETSLGILG